MSAKPWSIGSRWLRWDPHLHAPGTLRNDQFGKNWDAYIQKIEQANPAPVALGITDYFCLRCYKEVVARRCAGALKNTALVFPNLEMRLTIETKDRQGINIHLLISPEDPEHVERITEKLSRLRFSYREDRYSCTEEGLVRLGRVHRGDKNLATGCALAEGANQFKVELSELRSLFNDEPWVRKNVLVAVAAGKDGLAGISQDAAFHAQREELGRFADIVFSGMPGDRAYWLGEHPDFEKNGQVPKPCLNGSDAHCLEKVLVPEQSRLCWIRAEPTYDGLRQTLVEPARRVYIGEAPPSGAAPCDVIRFVRFKGAPWLENSELEFNSGLVTIVGARGSGKTALLDLLAFGAEADEAEPGPASFIAKAKDRLVGTEVEVEWSEGTKQTSILPRVSGEAHEPRVRYLSQQFVERLCSPGGLAEPLIEEIERVVFEAIPEEDRMFCSTFAELRSSILEGPAAECAGEREAIRGSTATIAEENALQRALPSLRTKTQDAERERKRIEKEISALPLKADDVKVKAQEDAAAKLTALKSAIAAEEQRSQSLRDLAAEVQRQVRAAESSISTLKTRYGALLQDGEWDLLRLRVHEDAAPVLARLEKESRATVGRLREFGMSARALGTGTATGPGQVAPEGLTFLESERERLTKALGLDEAKAKQRGEMVKRLDAARQVEGKARKALEHAEGAIERLKAAAAERVKQYERVFGSLVAEEKALQQLYDPLRRRLAADPRLAKLRFSVRRVVGLRRWAERGEALLDLRKPPFQGKGALEDAARKVLLQPWLNGTPQEASLAVGIFLDQYANSASNSLAEDVTPLDLGEWLFSTDHISVRYSITYEGVEIVHLSPGTRGVVLLTLYLGLDEWDKRPLVIDQPEENLDPCSAYSELVPFFRDAAQRRQIIMVTHNANLVVNTDSDQVIIADAKRTSPSDLPHFTYIAGGLEDSAVREHVCRLLEGGRDAFQKRGMRYGIERRP